jgi:3-deoxy-D-manno-oct-2-ulosonic acid (Kdo) hydroxylase
MDALFAIPGSGPFSDEEKERAIAALESGRVIVLQDRGFALAPQEKTLLTPRVLGRAKNVSLEPSGHLKHTAASRPERAALEAMMGRFAAHTKELVEDLLPAYRGRLTRGRTSFRPAEIEGRSSSALRDDTRLHVDAFPSTPMRGRRILRVFANVNPGEPRIWIVGEPFAVAARRFLPRIARRPAVWNAAFSVLGVTKGRRTAYDDLMLGLHDTAKLDLAYQRDCPRQQVAFAPGTIWLCYTDQVMHAAVKGQYALEQTFHLPVEAMIDPARSPLRLLEDITRRELI